MAKAPKKAKKKAIKKEKPLKLDMSFEDAVKLSIRTKVKQVGK